MQLYKEETGACGVHRFYMKKIYYEKEILVNILVYRYSIETKYEIHMLDL